MLPERYRNSVAILEGGIDKYEAFSRIMESCFVVPDRAGFLSLVTERERIQSTGIGHGVAIAHGKRSSVDRVHIILGISREGIRYDDEHEEKVHLIFMISSAFDDEPGYLKALGAIISWVHDEKLRRDLVNLDMDNPDVVRFLDMFSNQEFSRYEN